MRIERELMRGSGPLAVLQLLSRREMYGYEIVEALSKTTSGALAMGQSTLYPMLYNLESKGLISSRVESGEQARVRRYYRLTALGRKELARQRASWRVLIQAMRALGITDPVTSR